LPPPNRGVAQVATVGEEMFAAADRLFIGLHIVSNREIEQNVWRQAIFRLATTKIPDTCCNFFFSSLVSLLLAVPKRSAEGRSGGPANPLFCAVRVYSCSRMFQNEAG